MSFALSVPLPLQGVLASPPPQSRMVQLDGIRGLAVLGVLGWHWLQPYFRYFPIGIVSVRVFFVLSGFLITGILLRTRRDNELASGPWWAPLRHFYIRRVLRIFPLYYAVLALLFVGTLFSERVLTVENHVGWYLLYLSNFLNARHPDLGGSTVHFWSLAVEEQFYLFWPLLILFSPRRMIPWLIGSLIAIGPIYRLVVISTTSNYQAATVLPMGCFDSLGAGALVAWAVLRGSWQMAARLTTISLAIGAPTLALGIFFYCNRIEIGWITLTDLGVALTAAWIIWRASNGFPGMVGRCLSFPPLIYMGTISYGVYILHPFIHNILLVSFAKLNMGVPRMRVQLPIEFAATLAVATISWFLFERHLVRLGRALTPQRAQNRN